MELYFLSCYLVVALVIGSFLNVCIYRVPRGISVNGNEGHSMCPKCSHRLKWYDLVPVISYLMLGGKCRYCKGKISARYPLIESANVILWLLVWTQGMDMITTVLTAVSFSVLLVIFVVDIDTMLIPDSFNVTLAVLGVLLLILGDGPTVVERLIGIFAVSVPMLILTLIIPGGFGGGDIKLMAAAGFLIGYRCIIVAMFLGVFIGGVQGVILMIKGNSRKAKMPFGPSLAIGIAAASLWGEMLWNWYKSLYL